MRSLAVVAALTAVTFAMPGFAQTPPADGTQQQGPAASHHAAIEQHIRADLAKAGFTDIHVMPESFLVRAKNAQGLPVMMVINPDSVTAITAMAPKSGAAGGNSPAVGSQPGGATPQ